MLNRGIYNFLMMWRVGIENLIGGREILEIWRGGEDWG